jgi:molybdate transport system substrate-binding protein
VRRLVALGAVALAASGCGGKRAPLTIYAASSLTGAFQKLDPGARFDFSGSDTLAFQIEQGAEADVYASASTKYPRELHTKGLADRPQVFATNRLVLIVPRSNPAHLTGLRGLLKPVRLVLGAPGVPAGDYARSVLRAYCGRSPHCPAAKVVSEEQDVKGVVAKVALGEADAGFAYATDARAAAGKVRAIPIPPSVAPDVRYSIAVLKDTSRRKDAEVFVRLVLGPTGRAVLHRAGFGLP